MLIYMCMVATPVFEFRFETNFKSVFGKKNPDLVKFTQKLKIYENNSTASQVIPHHCFFYSFSIRSRIQAKSANFFKEIQFLYEFHYLKPVPDSFQDLILKPD